MRKPKSLAKLKNDLQKIFNEYIRKRDEGKPCISCGQYKTLQAGHFYSVRMYDGLRFNEDNCHGECVGCNCFDESHLIHYGENLLNRIGHDRFFQLKGDANFYKQFGNKWNRSELHDIIDKYSQEIKELK